MEKPGIRIEKTATEVRIRGRGFATADEIYFCHVLPGDHLASDDGFSFDLKRLGQHGFSELLSYLESHGYVVGLDASANDAIEKMNRDRAELSDALKVGARLKRKQKSSFGIPGFKRKLKSFQFPAVAHMAGVTHVANFSVPGSGKTTIALAAFAKLRKAKGLKALVVVGPRSSFAPWEHEFEECLGKIGNIIRITGNKAERARAWRDGEKAVLVLLNYRETISQFLDEGGDFTEKQMEESLREKRLLGDLAETFVVEFERARLAEGGHKLESGCVQRISKHRVNAGYDVKSFDGPSKNLNHDRFIEVKGSGKKTVYFFWTQNEIQKATKLGDKYWIYFVGAIDRKNRLVQREPVMIQNPHSQMKSDPRFQIRPNNMLVEANVCGNLFAGREVAKRKSK